MNAAEMRMPLAAALAATSIFAFLTFRVDFTFLADDYGHLAAAHSLDNLYGERFVYWLNRVPVWSVLAWALFGSHAREFSWAPMYLFFFCHALGIALIARWLESQLPDWRSGETRSSRPLLYVSAVAALALYPNTYEILYWPTCMPYAVGPLLLALALLARSGPARAALLTLTFLTYETFVLPSLALCLTPQMAGLRWRRQHEETLRRLLRQFVVWASALGMTLLVRWMAALSLGPYAHKTRLTAEHVSDKATLAWKELFELKFFAAEVNEPATTAQYALLALVLYLSWRSLRWTGPMLLALCFLSTGLYWILEYNAIRAIYGSQVLLLAIVVVLAARTRPGRLARTTVIAALLLAFAGYVHQALFIYSVKSHNAEVLRATEARFSDSIRACTSPCIIESGPLDEGLRPDWVLHPDYWNRYLAYVKAKYGPEKQITFRVAGREVTLAAAPDR